MSMNAYGAANEMKHKYLEYGVNGAGLFWFVILTLIVFMLLVFFKPDFVLREKDCEYTDEVDCMKALLSAVVIAVVVCFIIAVIAYGFYC
jgi:Na+/proline symporter